MIKIVQVFLFAFFCPLLIICQDLENNPAVMLMKANVLFDESRFDEAVRMYNRILNEHPSFDEALFMRGKAKYELGAYRGTKNDILELIDLVGIDKKVIKLMASTEFELNRFEAAANYSATAIELDPYDADMYYLAGRIEQEKININLACEHFVKAASLGHNKAHSIAKKRCGYESQENTSPSTHDEDIDDDPVSEQDAEASPPQIKEEEIQEEKEPEEEDVSPAEELDLVASQDITIDDHLSLEFKNGLGSRKIQNLPNILLLSDQNGQVVIEACVDSEGRVINTNYDSSQSTINRTSLISLALRKTRDIIFVPSFRSETCGDVVFHIVR